MIKYSSYNFAPYVFFFFKTQHLKAFHIVTKRESLLVFIIPAYFIEWIYHNLTQSSIDEHVVCFQSLLYQAMLQ